MNNVISDNVARESGTGITAERISQRMLRIFLTDDHAVVREGLKTLINAQPDMQVVGEAESGEGAWQQIQEMRAWNAETLPDVVVMDVSMPGWSGAETTAQVRNQWPQVKVLALSMHEDKSYLRSLLESGASGYVLKRSAAAELIRAIRVVATGNIYLDPSLSEMVADSLVRSSAGGSASASATALRGEIGGSPLSERESSVLRLIAQGYTNKEIAVQLKVSVKSVETYKARSMEKLSLDSRADIVRYALAQGWLHG